MTRVVLFGGGGFIGSAIAADWPDVELVTPRRSDVDLVDRPALGSLLRPGDIVVNAAGYAEATDRSEEGRARFRRDNVTAMESLAAAAGAARVGRLVHLSSVAAMGQRTGVDLTEDDLAVPRSPYGKSKRDAELVLGRFTDDVPITILRPTSVFGEGRPLARTLVRLASLPVIPLPAGGRAEVPFSYVGNLVAAVRLAAVTPACAGRTFIVGDDRSYPLREVVLTLAAALGRTRAPHLSAPVVLLRAVGVMEGAARRVVGGRMLLDPVRIETLTSSVSYSTKAFREATGFEPPFSLGAGLERIAAAARGARPDPEPAAR